MRLTSNFSFVTIKQIIHILYIIALLLYKRDRRKRLQRMCQKLDAEISVSLSFFFYVVQSKSFQFAGMIQCSKEGANTF